MRRPLFWVALCLVLAAAVRLETGACDRTRAGFISTRQMTAGEAVTVVGQVYQKDEEYLYLRDVFLTARNSSDFSFDFSDDISDDISNEISNLIFDKIPDRQIPVQENLKCQIFNAERQPLGSVVTLCGTFMPFSEAGNPGEFDAAEYYRTLRLGGRLVNAEQIDSDGKCRWLWEKLYELRKFLKGRLYRAVPEREAAVLTALLLGDKTELDGEIKELYQRNGILHILSISSLHITMIGMSLYKMLRKAGLPIGISAAAGSVLLLLYGGMTGFGVSACRAIGMYLLRMLAEILGRTYDMLTAWAVLAAVMVTVNPYFLRHSGFLLSFGSVLGIGVVYNNLAPSPQRFGEDGERKGILRKMREKFMGAALAGVSVTLTTLPIQLWFYYEVPTWSVLLNLLVLPWMKLLMGTGMASMLPAGSVWGMAAGAILRYYELLCGCFDRLPFSVWNPGRPRLWQILLYYAILGGTTAFCGYRRKKDVDQKCGDRKCGGKKCGDKKRGEAGEILTKLAPAAALVLAVSLFAVRPARENRAVFLDVGQGDCIIVQTRSGENYLFDCGSTSRKDVGRYVLLPYLKYCGIRRLDAVFVSHPDEDHVNGIKELLAMREENGISVLQLVLPAIEATERESQLGELLRAGEGLNVRYLAAGDGWRCGDADFLCVNPEENGSAENKNAYSLCIYMRIGEDMSMLLTGDVEGEGEEKLLEALRERSVEETTVLKVAHHGSRNATTEEFLRQTPPRIAVISCGKNNRYGHPHRELLERLEETGAFVIKTSEAGAVTLSFRRGEVSVRRWRKLQYGQN